MQSVQQVHGATAERAETSSAHLCVVLAHCPGPAAGAKCADAARTSPSRGWAPLQVADPTCRAGAPGRAEPSNSGDRPVRVRLATNRHTRAKSNQHAAMYQHGLTCWHLQAMSAMRRLVLTKVISLALVTPSCCVAGDALNTAANKLTARRTPTYVKIVRGSLQSANFRQEPRQHTLTLRGVRCSQQTSGKTRTNKH